MGNLRVKFAEGSTGHMWGILTFSGLDVAQVVGNGGYTRALYGNRYGSVSVPGGCGASGAKGAIHGVLYSNH